MTATAGKYLLGTGTPSWAWRADFAAVQVLLFISYSRLHGRKTPFPRALVPVYIDSSGYMHVGRNGGWKIFPGKYVDDVLRFCRELGTVVWAAPQDWPCEEVVFKGGWTDGIYFIGTGLTVREHQWLTVENFILLRLLWELRTAETGEPCPFIPVLQGWTVEDYVACIRMYDALGVNLYDYKVVGVGSTCRRENTDEIEEIVDTILDEKPGLKIHIFGGKTGAAKRVGRRIASWDSSAWSAGVRKRNIRLDACRDDPTVRHKNCNSCPRYALIQYRRLAAIASEAPPRSFQRTISQLIALAADEDLMAGAA